MLRLVLVLVLGLGLGLGLGLDQVSWNRSWFGPSTPADMAWHHGMTYS